MYGKGTILCEEGFCIQFAIVLHTEIDRMVVGGGGVEGGGGKRIRRRLDFSTV